MITEIHPKHFEDLRKSGLSDETIIEAGIKSVSPDLINKRLGFNISRLASMYEIPYCDGFSRFRAFYEDGKEGNKYLQKKGTRNRLYTPEKVIPILDDISIHLYITEGEKKALKATQDGLYCIGLSGLWNWSNGKKELIPDFDLITLKNRTVYIVPDNDWLTLNKHGYRKNLKQAVYELANSLKTRGANVFIVELPQTKEKGIDDYLCIHSVDEFKQLPIKEVKSLVESIEDATPENFKHILSKIAKVESETERSVLIEKLSKKLNVGKRAIQADVKRLRGTDKTENVETVISANFPELIDLVIDENGEVAYLIYNDDEELQIKTAWEVDGVLYSPPQKAYLPFELPKANEVIKWSQTDNDKSIFEDALTYLKRFSYLPDNQWLIVICTIFLSYIQDHKSIHYLPELLFFAVPERGKSRTGKAVTYVAYRGIHTLELREANLFRFSQDLKATIFFDIMDLWKKAERSGCVDILLGRYEKGHKAVRVLYPDRGAFNDMVYYDIYGSTIIATNESVHKILDTRCIPITMPNKPNDYENPTKEKAQGLKERLTAWRARVIDKPLPEIESIQGLNGRLLDISKPLLQICKLVYPDSLEELKDALLEVAGERIEDKKISIEGQIVNILYELSPRGVPEWTIKTSEVLERLNEDRPDKYKIKSSSLGKKRKAMGLNARGVHGKSEIILNISDFNILLTQYGLETISLPPCPETLPNPTTPQNQGISTAYTGRELSEDEGIPTEPLPEKSLSRQRLEGLVDSGRELQRGKKKIFSESLEVVKDV
jgi:hypothetical protein